MTNGELAYRSYKNMEEKVGLPLTHLAEKSRNVRMTYEDLQARPHRYLSSPMWSGLIEYGRAYSPFTYNVRRTGALADADRDASISTWITLATSSSANICRPTSRSRLPFSTPTSASAKKKVRR